MKKVKEKFIEKKDQRVRRRWFLMFVLGFLLTVFYFNGREVHISEEIGEKEVEVF